jgi:hypothetical protein
MWRYVEWHIYPAPAVPLRGFYLTNGNARLQATKERALSFWIVVSSGFPAAWRLEKCAALAHVTCF